MTYINNDLIFIHIPKSAGTSIKKILNTNKSEKFNNIIPHSHQTSCQIFNCIGEIKYKKRVSFCVFRNPYERMVSIYRFIFRPNKLIKWYGKDWIKAGVKLTTFEGFLKNFDQFDYPLVGGWQGNNHKSPQMNWARKADLIFDIHEQSKLEEFIKSFFNLEISHFHFNSRKVPSNKNKMYREFYNFESKKLIKKWFEEDIDYFKYNF